MSISIQDDNHSKNGLYDCSCWQIDQTMYDELMGNLPAKKFSLVFFGKKNKDKDKDNKGVGEEDVSVDLLSGEGVELGAIGGGGGGD